jgi:hypothetical protein
MWKLCGCGRGFAPDVKMPPADSAFESTGRDQPKVIGERRSHGHDDIDQPQPQRQQRRALIGALGRPTGEEAEWWLQEEDQAECRKRHNGVVVTYRKRGACRAQVMPQLEAAPAPAERRIQGRVNMVWRSAAPLQTIRLFPGDQPDVLRHNWSNGTTDTITALTLAFRQALGSGSVVGHPVRPAHPTAQCQPSRGRCRCRTSQRSLGRSWWS